MANCSKCHEKLGFFGGFPQRGMCDDCFKEMKPLKRAAMRAAASTTVLTLAACGSSSNEDLMDLIEPQLTVVDPPDITDDAIDTANQLNDPVTAYTLSDAQTVVFVEGRATGATIDITDIRSNKLDASVVVTGVKEDQGTLTFKFVDDDDLVILSADSEIKDFSVIVVMQGTVDFSNLPEVMLDGVTLQLGSGAVLSTKQFLSLSAVAFRENAEGGTLAISFSEGDDLNAVLEKLNGQTVADGISKEIFALEGVLNLAQFANIAFAGISFSEVIEDENEGSDGDGNAAADAFSQIENSTLQKPIRLQGEEGLLQDRYPQISEMNAENVFLVTWQGETLNGYDIFVQPFELIDRSDGIKAIEAVRPLIRLKGLAEGPMDQAPMVSTLAEDGFVIVWQGNSKLSQEWDIFVQRFDAEGNTVGEVSNLRGALGMLRDEAPQVSPLWDGGFVVTWEGLTSDGQGSDIFVQKFNKEGNKDGGPIRLHSMSGNVEDVSPKISTFSNGGFVVTWEGSTSDAQGKDIFAQRFDKVGLQEGDIIRLRGMSGDLLDWQPQISALSNNNFAITWTGNTSNSQGWDIFVQMFDENGDTVGEMSRLRGMFGELRDHSPQISALADGKFIVVWQGDTSDGRGFDIFTQQFDDVGFKTGGATRLVPIESIVSLSEDQSAIKVKGLPVGATINVSDIKSDEYNQVTIMAMGVEADGDTLTFNFEDENDLIVLSRDSVIENFSTIEIVRGTVDFTALPADMLNNVTLKQELSAYISAEQFLGTEGFVGDWYPQLTAFEDSGVIVTWAGGTSDGQSYDIFSQLIHADDIYGFPGRSYGIVGDLEDWGPQVSQLSDVGFVVTWQGGTRDGQGRDVFVKFFPETLQASEIIA